MENNPVMHTRVVGVYHSRDTADEIAGKLADKGIPREQIEINHINHLRETPNPKLVTESVFDELKNFFHSVFDHVDKEKIQEAYTKVAKGNIVVSVGMQDENQVKKVASFMHETYGRHFDKKPLEKKEGAAKNEVSKKTNAKADKEEKNLDSSIPRLSDALVLTNIFDKNPDED